MTIEITAITLLASLITKELVGAMDSKRSKYIAKCLNVPIIPLLILFVIVVVVRVIEIVS